MTEESVRFRDEPAEPQSTATSVARLLLGTAVVAGERAVDLVSQWAEAASERPESGGNNEATEVLVGAAVELAALAATGFEVARQVYGRAIKPFLEALADTPPVRPMTDRADHRMEQLQDAGAEELARARAIAHTAFNDAIDRIFDLLSDSPQLQQLIASQSVGLGKAAVDDFRGLAAKADELSEAVVRGIFGRRSRDEDAASAG